MNKNSEIEKLEAEVERLKKELKKKKKYGLVWEDKAEDVVERCKKELPVLKEVKKMEIMTDKTKPVNLLIEGDNYHALSVLNYTHKGKIDVIYIDPPYNTGNNDFKYNDKFIDAEDPFRHSKWLSFMEKRLRLARNLLKGSGLIFISINDVEIAQLKILCDDVFHEPNCLAIISWQSTDTLRNDAKYFSANSEFILCYAKEKAKAQIKGIIKGEKQKNYYKRDDHNQTELFLDLQKRRLRVLRKKKEFGLTLKGRRSRRGRLIYRKLVKECHFGLFGGMRILVAQDNPTKNCQKF